ncbi:MAG: Auxin-responsive GH3-related protein [Rhodocyclales bacterium GT-UBC]|nr:MAG: Auxin-responsive GH3-related protein [Rhodocyclales bacterium GT-UBC]
MRRTTWSLPALPASPADPAQWLAALLRRNAGCAYLRRFGSPTNEAEFRHRVPLVTYDDLQPEIDRLGQGEPDVLFAGRPLAFERTGGSSGGSKLIPYSAEGLLDFQHNLAPWLAHTVRRHALSGSAYFATSPVARQPESFGGYPIGLPDGAYLGAELGAVLQRHTAVPFSVASIEDIVRWREATQVHLQQASDLELISVWSPSFLLRLCAGIGDPQQLWPRLKVISCWASGPARQFLPELQAMFPHAAIEPKGLLSTEGVVTVPDATGRCRLAPGGYFEFRRDEAIFSASELIAGAEYDVIVTTASGLYRYASGDRVRCEMADACGFPVLEFIGRDALSCDLVGEKLTDAFVARCLGSLEGFSMLVPDMLRPGYVLISASARSEDWLQAFESRLGANPQYAYARRLGQLGPLRQLVRRDPFAVVERVMHGRGVRLGDIKPTALRADDFWLPIFEEMPA